MQLSESVRIRLLRIAYWLGICLDALAFVQMAFPEVGRSMMKMTIELQPDYIFAINLAAGLMLAWTLLLIWADRKPLERRMIIPMTMIIMVWNICTMFYGLRVELIPAATLLPELVAASALFFYYGFCSFVTRGMNAADNT